ncbi:MAG: hypothetical protein WC640_03835 [Candidatus Paceibacterota bacterium]|jgi:hypothetical protein
MPGPKILTISLPGYTIDSKPDYIGLGRKIDEVVEDNFVGQKIAIRAISSADHPNLSLDDLAQIILETGTDKYDPERKGVSHEEFKPYHADLQASACEVIKGQVNEGTDIIQKFYENAPLDRGYALRIDLLLIYDLDQLVQAEKVELDKPGTHPRLEPYLFRFKNPDHKLEALLGIIKIL